MSGRALVFVDSPGQAHRDDAESDFVVLDTTWTPAPGDGPNVRSIRPVIQDVASSTDLFRTSLERLDTWAADVGLPDLLAFWGVSWWYHARGAMRHELHELLLWQEVMERLAPNGRYQVIRAPRSHRALADVLKSPSASTASVVLEGAGPERRYPWMASRAWRERPRGDGVDGLRRRARRVVRRVSRLGRPSAEQAAAAMVDARLDRLVDRRPAVMAVVRPHSFHTLRRGGRDLRHDPYVEPVLQRLAAAGTEAVVVAESLDVRDARDRAYLEADERVLPFVYLAKRWADDPGPDDGIARSIADLPRAPVMLGGRDLEPALREIVGGAELADWFARQRRMADAARALIERLQPAALLTGWESARTAWLAAARQAHLPTVAIQHGVIYPGNPDYTRPDHATRVRPSMTCVFGSYEQELLLASGYPADEVVVSGSPRFDPERIAAPLPASDRDDVRRELAVGADERLLVVSTGRGRLGDGMYGMAALACIFDGPLPGVHVVFKVHPEEKVDQRYERLVMGLARALGHRAPAMTTVRDIDVYRLLRASDAHVGLYSTVLTDAVVTGTPNMIIAGLQSGDLIDYVARGVATPVSSAEDVRAFMDDPARPTEIDRSTFIGQQFRSGDAVERIADAVRRVATTTVGPTG